MSINDLTYNLVNVTANDPNVTQVTGLAKIDTLNHIVYLQARFSVTADTPLANALIKLSIGNLASSYGYTSMVNDAGGAFSVYIDFRESNLYIKNRVNTPTGIYSINCTLLY